MAGGAPAGIYTEIRNPRKASEGGHIEYEVCALLTQALPGSIQQVQFKWSVWHRYSEFADLNAALKESHQFPMRQIRFPPKRMFGGSDPKFVEQRRADLETWLRAVLNIPGIQEFSTHGAGSNNLRAFLNFDKRHEGMAREDQDGKITDPAVPAASGRGALMAAIRGAGGNTKKGKKKKKK